MKSKGMKIPAIIIAVGLILAVVAHFVTSIRQAPAVTEHDFDFSITYKLDGETKTIEGVYSCRFSGFGDDGVDPLDRYYEGEYIIDGVTDVSHTYVIDQKGTVDLYIIMLFNDSYLMGDTKNESYAPLLEDPTLEAVDNEGYSYESEDGDPIEMFDAEIVSWEYPDPVENSFEFAGFSGFHAIDMSVMLLIGILTLILCMILVKKDEGVVFGVLDTIGVLWNFVIIFIALPVTFLASVLIQVYTTGPAWIYQVFLCVPPIIAFTVAASVSLRRKGYRKSGFFVQFIGPAMEVLLCIFEYIL